MRAVLAALITLLISVQAEAQFPTDTGGFEQPALIGKVPCDFSGFTSGEVHDLVGMVSLNAQSSPQII